MPAAIPEKYLDLFQKKTFASLGTLMPDGQPQVTPVWIDFDGKHVVVNSAKGRVKDRNMRRDPRVTPVGGLLRRFSLDEVPQLFNVLRGEMSLVGPRPLPLRDYAQLEDWHRKRYNVLPGVTGLWQISGRSNLTFDDLVRLDFYYLENWSLWLDITILVKTLPAVIGRRGAY